MRTRAINYTAIIFSAWIVAFVVLLMYAGSSRAGQIEYDVINESWATFIDAPEAETGAEVQPFLDDINEIQDDTVVGSYCETLAASYAFYIATYQDVVDATEYDPEVYAAMTVATQVVVPELDRLATACQQED